MSKPVFVARSGKRGSGFGGRKNEKKKHKFHENGRFKNVGGVRSEKAEIFAASQSSVESLQDGLGGDEENESSICLGWPMSTCGGERRKNPS